MKLRFFHYPKMAYFIPFNLRMRARSIRLRLGWRYFSLQLHDKVANG